MRVFVSEYLVGGASAGLDLPNSMRREGLLMLQSVATDIARIPGYSVVTTLESGIDFPADIEVVRLDDPVSENRVFRQLVNEVDAVLVIAPETGGILAERCQIIRDAGVNSWNCSVPAIELCADKFLLAEHLQQQGILTIPTRLADVSQPPANFDAPIVLKPRDGAGSQLTFLVRNHQDWEAATEEFRRAREAENCLIQPFVEGIPLSIGVIISLAGKQIEPLPIARQQLSSDGRFQYLGGRMPADVATTLRDRINDLALQTCHSIPGLAGYLGIDLVVTTDEQIYVVEINPRLTTSYIGYRQLFSGLMPELWINPVEVSGQLNWKSLAIEFITQHESIKR